MINKLAVFLGLLLATAGGALADQAAEQVIEREFACPVCGSVFYAKLDLADLPRQMRLDLKPVGPGAGPWRLPDCPKCGFVSYKYPVPAEELAKCRKIVSSADFKKYLGRSSYFRVGLLYEKLRKPAYRVATSFLKASWQEEGEAGNLKEDLELGLKYFGDCALTCDLEERENSQLLTGELLRRLGRFGEAQAHLTKLRGTKGFKNNFFADIVDYQLKLCSKNDAAPYEMEDVRDFKRPFYKRIAYRVKKILNRIGEFGGDVRFRIKDLW